MLPDELLRKIEFEFELIDAELEVVSDLKGRGLKASFNRIELRALAASLHSIYNGIEKIIMLILKEKGVCISKDQSWHSTLLKEAQAAGCISVSTEISLRDLMGFRHFFRHAYGFMLDQSLLEPLYQDIDVLVARFRSEIMK